MSAIDFALSIAGMSDAEVADLKQKMPAFARLADTAKQIEPALLQAKPHIDALAPLIAQAMPHIDALVPIFAKEWPVISKALPDVVSITPTAQDLIAFIKSKLGPGGPVTYTE